MTVWIIIINSCTRARYGSWYVKRPQVQDCQVALSYLQQTTVHSKETFETAAAFNELKVPQKCVNFVGKTFNHTQDEEYSPAYKILHEIWKTLTTIITIIITITGNLYVHVPEINKGRHNYRLIALFGV